MKSHLFRITVEHIETPEGEAVSAPPLVFETRNHDDLFAIVERMQARCQFGTDESAAFAIGLKLFGETLLKHKNDELFKPLQPHFGEFMKGLKAGLKKS